MLMRGKSVPYHIVVVDLEEVEFFSVGRHAIHRGESFVFNLSNVMAECYNGSTTFPLDRSGWNLPMNEMHCQRLADGHRLTQMTTPMPFPGSVALFTTKSSFPSIGNLTPSDSTSCSKPPHRGIERTAEDRLAGFCLR